MSLGDEDLGRGGAPRAVAACLEGCSARPFLPTVRPPVGIGGASRQDAPGRGASVGWWRTFFHPHPAPRRLCGRPAGRSRWPRAKRRRKRIAVPLTKAWVAAARPGPIQTRSLPCTLFSHKWYLEACKQLPEPLRDSILCKNRVCESSSPPLATSRPVAADAPQKTSRLVLARPATLAAGPKFKNCPVLRGL